MRIDTSHRQPVQDSAAELQTTVAPNPTSAARNLWAVSAGPSVSSPWASASQTAQLPGLVKADDRSQFGADSPQPGGHLGTSSGPPLDLDQFDSPLDKAIDQDTEWQLPDLTDLDPQHGIRIPGGEASDGWGDLVDACVEGARGESGGGLEGMAVGCAAGVALELAAAILSSAPDEDITPPAMGTPHDMGAPADPKNDPNPAADANGGYTPKFALPSLGWLDPVRLPPSEGDPIGIEKDEPSDVLRIMNPAVDPNPNADPPAGGAMRGILSTSGAVTDPNPEAGVLALSRMLNTFRMSNLAW